MTTTLITDLRDEADLCRNEAADDIAVLLDAAAAEIERLRGLIKAHIDASNNDGSAGDTFGALMAEAHNAIELTGSPQAASPATGGSDVE